MLSERIFLNHAYVSPLPSAAARAMVEYAETTSRRPSQPDAYRRAGAFRARAAELIHASPDEIAAVPNTTTGLGLIAHGLDWSRGGAVVTTAIEFPANRYPWEALQRRHGVRFVAVEPEADGRINFDFVITAMRDSFVDGRTNLLTVSHAQFSTGQLAPVAVLADEAHRLGGFVALDAIQTIGLLPFNPSDLGVDFAAADGHKWMLGPEGAGIFYCRKDLIDTLEPMIAGWLSMTKPFDFLEYRFEYREGARRYEPGCWNVAGLTGLAASLELLLEVGEDAIWSSVREMTACIREEAARAGWREDPVLRPEEQSGIVTLRPGGTKVRLDLLERAMSDRGVDVAVRGGRLRLSPHFYNTIEQIEEAFRILRSVT